MDEQASDRSSVYVHQSLVILISSILFSVLVVYVFDEFDVMLSSVPKEQILTFVIYSILTESGTCGTIFCVLIFLYRDVGFNFFSKNSL